MKVGEIGFVIQKPDGTFIGRPAGRSGPERPFRCWADAELHRSGRTASWQATKNKIEGEVVPVRLVVLDVPAIKNNAGSPA